MNITKRAKVYRWRCDNQFYTSARTTLPFCSKRIFQNIEDNQITLSTVVIS